MQTPMLYRKRLIPNECVLLDKDQILFSDSCRIVTAWQAIHPRSDLAFGYSLYLPSEGIKISRFYDHMRRFLYWYCDIIETDAQPAENRLVFTDLLIDVKLFPDGSCRILDLDEVSRAFRDGLLTSDQLLRALECLDRLLGKIYDGSFHQLEAGLPSFIPEALR